MKLFSKIASAGVTEAVTSIGNAVDSIVTNDEERGKIKAELTTIVANTVANLTASAKEVIAIELTGNWLQRSWRPLIMLAFGFVVVWAYFNGDIATFPERFWNLLEIGFGGYVIGRTVEKSIKTIAENLDKLPGKKERT